MKGIHNVILVPWNTNNKMDIYIFFAFFPFYDVDFSSLESDCAFTKIKTDR